MRLVSPIALAVGLAIATPVISGPAAAAGIGIVLLHARGSWPGFFDNIAPQLQAAGYKTAAPELCWSVHRQYSDTVDPCQKDIDTAVASLKAAGADQIVLAGHDLGALDAIYYSETHPGIAAVVAWEPRQNIRFPDDDD